MKYGLRKPGCTHTLSQKKIERKQNLKIRAGQKIFFQDKEAFSKLSSLPGTQLNQQTINPVD
jgi:hypothetical protein